MMNNEENMKKNNTVLCPGKSKRDFCDGKKDCWETNFCECPEAQNLCKKNMAKKIMKDFNINDNEEKERILNIFHGNSTTLYNLSKTEQKNQMNETSEKRPMYSEKEDYPADAQAYDQGVSPTVDPADAQEDDQTYNQGDTQRVNPANAQEDDQGDTQGVSPAVDSADDQAVDQTYNQGVSSAVDSADNQARKMTMGGMNMLEETMEILNKFHGGSINYEKF